MVKGANGQEQRGGDSTDRALMDGIRKGEPFGSWEKGARRHWELGRRATASEHQPTAPDVPHPHHSLLRRACSVVLYKLCVREHRLPSVGFPPSLRLPRPSRGPHLASPPSHIIEGAGRRRRRLPQPAEAGVDVVAVGSWSGGGRRSVGDGGGDGARVTARVVVSTLDDLPVEEDAPLLRLQPHRGEVRGETAGSRASRRTVRGKVW